MAEFIPKYLPILEKQGRQDVISRSYKRLMHKFSEFEVEEPSLKLLISQASYDQNDPKIAIKLLHGIQKKHPDYKELIPALSLLADALDEFPKYVTHAAACRKMIQRMSHTNSI